MAEPYIPETITVHLGTPDSNAANTTVSFINYIKNVASGEIYPTWPNNSLRANIYAQITFALNRYFTEYYRSRGKNFDITNSTLYDQYYKPGREIYQSVSNIVDEIFDSYVERQGTVGPMFTSYCNGTTVTCDGLSQWGTVTLANQGRTPYQILQYYYGNDINIETDVPVRPNVESYRGYSISNGDSGNVVRQIQTRLNRISTNYPAIPKVYPVDGIFGPKTESAVRSFQRIFNLTVDGIVGKATWYQIIYIYNGVKRLSELDSEGISVQEYSQQYPDAVRLGDTGDSVKVLQYFLSVLSDFYETIPAVQLNGIYDEQTREAVIAFQRLFGLEQDGIVGAVSWERIYRAYLGIISSERGIIGGTASFAGEPLQSGSRGEQVAALQQYLSVISESYPEIPRLPITGVFGQQTTAAVNAFQQLFGLPMTGVVGAVTWDSITSEYSDLTAGSIRRVGQYPGYELGE